MFRFVFFSLCVDEAISLKPIKCITYIYLVFFFRSHSGQFRNEGIILSGSVHALDVITQTHVQTGDSSPLNPYDELLSDGNLVRSLSPPSS